MVEGTSLTCQSSKEVHDSVLHVVSFLFFWIAFQHVEESLGIS